MFISKSSDHRLPCNVRAIQKSIRVVQNSGVSSREFRIRGVRGLVLLIMRSGTATWYYHYDATIGRTRHRRKLKLGRTDEISLAKAIELVDELRPRVRAGEDPAKERRPRSTDLTFRELADARFSKGDPLRPKTEDDYRLILKKDVLPTIGDLLAKDVSRERVIDILDRISERGADRRADTARCVISSIYSFAMDRGLVDNNPASNMRNRHNRLPRTVIATERDIQKIWHAIQDESAPMQASISRIIQLALLTGQRRTEICGARKDELDLMESDPTLTISSGRAKNRQSHRVPLSPPALTLFRDAVDESGPSLFVFPSPYSRNHIAPRSVSQAMERVRDKLNIKDVTVHDLRRTTGSYMSRYGVPRDVRERVLNHGGLRKGDITDGTYNQYDYDAEKRAALELWAEALNCIVIGDVRKIEGFHVRLTRLRESHQIEIG